MEKGLKEKQGGSQVEMQSKVCLNIFGNTEKILLKEKQEAWTSVGSHEDLLRHSSGGMVWEDSE